MKNQTRKLEGKTIVVKVGGTLVSSEKTLEIFAAEVSWLKSQGARTIVVHGGGDEISCEAEKRGIAPKFVNGLRVTDEAMLKVTEMVLSGVVNKRIAARLTQFGCDAVGISGKDGRVIIARKMQGSGCSMGYVGEVAAVETKLLELLCNGGFIPVVSPVSADKEGVTLNVNADTVTAAIAGAMKAEHVLFLTGAGGIYDADKRILPELSLKSIDSLIKNGAIDGGMLPKVKSVEDALQNGAVSVRICGCEVGSITKAVESETGGTRILF